MGLISWDNGTQFSCSASISDSNYATASGSTFSLPLPSISIRWLSDLANWPLWLGLGCVYTEGQGWVHQSHPYSLGLYYGNSLLDTWSARTTSSLRKSYSYSAAVWHSAPTTFNTSSIFGHWNKYTRVESMTLRADVECLIDGYNSQHKGEIDDWTFNPYTQTATSFTVTLDAPPVFNNSFPTITKDTAGYYRNATTVTVTSSAYAQYEGDLTSTTLTIGSQTATISGNGSLSIKLNALGTFTPRVTIVDSRGQSRSVDLTSFTVVEGADTTFDCTQVVSNKDGFWTKYTTASTTVSNISVPYGGSVTNIKFTIGNQSVSRTNAGTLSIIPNSADTFTPTVTVSDSLGRTFTKNLDSITVNAYVPPSIAFQVYRAKNVTEGGVTKYGIKDDEATTHILVQTKITYVKNTGKLLQPTVKVDDTTQSGLTWYTTYSETNGLSNTIDWETYNPNSPVVLYTLISGDFPQANSFVVGITVSDSTGESSIEIQQTLSPAFFTIDFLAGGHGIAFGQLASDNGFYCAMQANFINFSGVMRSIFDLFYPVGSYYETFLTSVPPSGRAVPTQEDLAVLGQRWFDPNYAWGGTWILETEGQVHVSAGNNYEVSGATSNISDGGSADAIVVSHSHTVDSHTHHIPGLSGTAADAGWHTHAVARAGNAGAGTNRFSAASGSSYNTEGAGTHSHSVETNESDTWGASPGTNSVGSSGEDANMMPYIVVYRWFRIQEQ